MKMKRVPEIAIDNGVGDLIGHGGNYERALAKWIEDHPHYRAGASFVHIAHDDSCGIFDSKPCDCEPVFLEEPIT